MKTVYKRVLAIVMAIAVAFSFCNVSSITSSNVIAKATKEDKSQLIDVVDSTKSGDDVDKSETVYVKADANGGVTEITVSDWLKNPNGADVLEDASDLNDIKNVKGKEEYEGSADTMKWQAKGNDIYYQGTTDKELPVDVNISYKLNGKKVSAEEIAGQSGDVEITFDYKNKETKKVKVDNKEYTVNVPFTVMSGMILKGKNFSNVTVDNGKVISDGDKSIIVGYAMPGLSDSLKLEDFDSTKDVDIPESVTVKAKALEFKLDITMTVISTNLLDTVDITNVNSIDDIKDDLEELNDASNQLVDGTGELKKGADKLNDKFSEYSDGVKTLVKGLNSAGDGADKLYDGATSLSSGAKKLDKGVAELKKGAKSFKDGTNQLDDGADSIKKGANSLKSGADGLSEGIDTFKKTFDDGVATSKKDTEEYIATKTAPALSKTVTDAVNTAASTAAKTASASIVTSIADSVGESGKTIGLSIRANVSDSAKATAFAKQLVKAGVITEEEIPTLSKLLSNTTFTDMLGNQIADGVSKNIKAAAADPSSAQSKKLTETIGANVQAALGDSAANGVKGALGDLGVYLNKQLDDSQKDVDKALSFSDSYKNEGGDASTLKDGADALAKGTDKLSSGADSFREGVGKLNEGANSIYDGADKLKAGTSKLSTGSNQLKNGILALKTGATKLVKGGKTLSNATDLLSDGIGDLDDGSNKLNDGMIEFDKQGIKVLYDTVDKDLKELLDRVEAVKKAGEEYQTFTKLSDKAKGEVKFIIETEAVKK